MDSSQYMKKCLDMLNNDNFIKLTDDPTKSIEGKIQRAIRKIKSKLSKDEYNKIYSTGSASGKLYGTANVHIMAEMTILITFLYDQSFQTLVQHLII